MLKGTLDDFTLPDIFHFLSTAQKTGRVDISRSAGEGRVFFREGEVYHAESSLTRDPIGQKLVRARLIGQADLNAALDEQANSDKRLGEILVEGGKLTQEQIEGAVRQQIEDAVFDLLRWDLGEFHFESGAEVDVEVPLSVSVENLIMEASRKLEELEVIATKIPSELAVMAMASSPPEGAAEINITPEEWRILVLVNGHRTVVEIAESVGLDNFSVMRTLFGLASTGLIEVVEVVEIADDEPAGLSIVETEPVPVAEAVPEPLEEVAAEPAAAESFEPEASEPEAIEPEAFEAEAFEAEEQSGPEVAADAADDEPAELEDDADVADDPAGDPNSDAAAEDATVFASLTDDKLSAFDELDAIESSEADPFASELLSDEPYTKSESPADDISIADDFASELDHEPAETQIPASAEGEEPVVDRLAAVRELADLFDQTDVSEQHTGGPPYPAELAAAQSAESGDEVHEDDGRRRVEDDEEITRGLISRLIDGVKGL